MRAASPEASAVAGTPVRDPKLTTAGTPLAPALDEFRAGLDRAGLRRLRPHFYLSAEGGVPFGTVSVAIPFYLARPDLTVRRLAGAGPVPAAPPVAPHFPVVSHCFQRLSRKSGFTAIAVRACSVVLRSMFSSGLKLSTRRTKRAAPGP